MRKAGCLVQSQGGTNDMTHQITVTDDLYRRAEAAASALNTTPERLVANLLARLPEPKPALPQEEYDQRWDEFLKFVGHITDGGPITNADIDEVIGEEAAGSDATGDYSA
jgi:hypothetical protein